MPSDIGGGGGVTASFTDSVPSDIGGGGGVTASFDVSALSVVSFFTGGCETEGGVPVVTPFVCFSSTERGGTETFTSSSPSLTLDEYLAVISFISSSVYSPPLTNSEITSS